MTTHFTIQDIEPDKSTFSRNTTVRLGTSGNVKFQTPLRAGRHGVTEIPFYEARKRVSPDTINNCMRSEEKDRKQGLDLRNRCKGKFNALTLEYDSSTVVPSDKMVETLSDMQYVHTDVIITPSWFDIITQPNSVDVDLYIKLSEIFVDTSVSLNNKPFMATIPQSIPPEDLQRVIDFFVSKDVTSFIVDSHGRTPISGSWIRTFQRSLSKYPIEKECLLCSVNAYQGAVRKNNGSMEAKDFIGFTAGFDIIGGKFVPKFPSKDEKRDPSTIGRIFNSETYTYTKKVCNNEEKIRIDEQSIRNQNNEFDNLRQIIREGGIMDTLSTKDLNPETLSTIRSFKHYSSSLDEFI